MLPSEKTLSDWQSLTESANITTPEALIADFNSRLPSFESNPKGDLSQVRDWLKAHNAPVVEIEQGMRTDYALESLNKHVLPRLPAKVARLVDEKRIVIAEINSRMPAARMWQCQDGRCAVVLTNELPRVYFRVIRALCTRVNLDGGEHKMSREATCQIISDIAFWHKHSFGSAGPSYPNDGSQIVFASILTSEAMAFCLAHEIVHAAIAIDPPPNIGSLDATQEEFAADAGAVVFFLRSKNTKLGDLTLCGAELFLRVQLIFQSAGIPFDFGVHPPFESRLAKIREAMIRELKTPDALLKFLSVANAFESLCKLVAEYVGDHSAEEASMNRAGRGIAAALDRLLDECACDEVPNYSRFYVEASKLLETPGSVEVMPVIENCMGEFLQMQKLGTTEIESAESRRRFKRYKLLYGFTKELGEPLRSVFAAGLGIQP